LSGQENQNDYDGLGVTLRYGRRGIRLYFATDNRSSTSTNKRTTETDLRVIILKWATEIHNYSTNPWY